jgi:hypothetical protein
VPRVGCRKKDRFVERDLDLSVAALLRVVCTRMIDEDSAHRARGSAKEVRPILPRGLVVREPVRLVDEVGRLKRVVATLAAQLTVRQPFQLGIDECEKARLDLSLTDA